MADVCTAAMPASFESWAGTSPTVVGVAAALAADAGAPWEGLDGLPAPRRDYVALLADRIRGAGGRVPDVGDLGGAHRYATGVLLSLMAACPADGTRLPEPSGDDPVLRAMVASFGRPRPYAAAVGPVFHWALERRLGRAVPDACFDALAEDLVALAEASAVPAAEGPARGSPWA